MFAPKNTSTLDYALAACSAIGAALTGYCAYEGAGVFSKLDASVYVNFVAITFGLYGLGFLLAPIVLIDMNFKCSTDRYHEFLGRFTGFLMLLHVYVFYYVLNTATAYKIGAIASTGCALLGPTYAALYLDPKQTPMGHMPAHFLFLIGGILALLCA